jgi:hypothetical protein
LQQAAGYDVARHQEALPKSQKIAVLCATSMFSVSLLVMNSEQKHTTETERT